MDTSKVLIIGCNGQLGRALQGEYPEAKAVDANELDITSKESLDNFDWSNIELVINAAAYTNVDGAEMHEGRLAAWQVNANAVGLLSQVAAVHSLILVHISTDYVFDGTKFPHQEDELFSPLSVYGASKAAGDIAAALTPKHYILRTSWVIGDGKNFVRTMLELGKKGIAPTVVADQVGRLTFTDTLVSTINHLLVTQAPYGVYNVSNDGEPASWADITRQIFKELGRDDLIVTDTTTAEYFAGKPSIAPRPFKSTLDLSKIKSLGIVLPNWRTELAAYIKKELKK